MASACQACHGANGEGNQAAGFPRLAGLPSTYLLRQLEGFAAGQRRSTIMEPIAKALSAADRGVFANHYAGLPVARRAAAEPAQNATAGDERGAALAKRGRWPDGLPACEQCHAPGGRGVGDNFPALAGQPAAYLAGQLRAWKSGARPPGPLGLMQAVAAKLSDADIDAVSRHYAAAPPAEGRK